MKKKKILIILFILFNIFILGFLLYSEFYKENSGVSFDIKVNYLFLGLSLVSFIVSILCEGFKIYLLSKYSDDSIGFKNGIKCMLIGKYFDNITPSGFGGQPSQILFLKKCGVSNAKSSAITLSSFLVLQICFVFMGLVSIFVGSSIISNDLIRVSSFIGLMFYSFVPCIIILFSIKPKIMNKISNAIIKFLHKINIIKDIDDAKNKINDSIKEYNSSFKLLFKSKRLLLLLVLFSIIYQICFCSLPYFVINALGGNIGFLDSLISTILIYATITLIPTPGSAGVAEGSFMQVFKVCSSNSLFFSLLLWRFYVFYSFIIIGMIIYLKRMIRGKKNG